MKGIPAGLALLGLFAGFAVACGATTQPAAAATITVTQADAGKTVQARVGDTVQIVLEEEFPVPGSSLVWSVRSSDTSVLAPGTNSGSPSPGPGVKKFTYPAEFKASASGQATLLAHGATSCEAMAKSNCPDRDFQVTVMVGS